MSVTVITGMDKLQKMNSNLMNRKNYIVAMDGMINETMDLIRKYAPRKTGELEASVKKKKYRDNFHIVVDAPYAKYMEYGTTYFPVPDDINAPMARTSTSGKACYHPFIRPAVWKKMREYKEKKIYFKALFKRN